MSNNLTFRMQQARESAVALDKAIEHLGLCARALKGATERLWLDSLHTVEQHPDIALIPELLSATPYAIYSQLARDGVISSRGVGKRVKPVPKFETYFLFDPIVRNSDSASDEIASPTGKSNEMSDERLEALLDIVERLLKRA